jgi:iron(III) transport system ATP-binding protein
MPSAKVAVFLDHVSKHFGATAAVDDVSLEIGAGELFFLLGPSGCGKTTLLRMLAGFVRPDTGQIRFDKDDVTDTPPRLRDAGMVFQTYALWPHLTVARNVAYGLQVQGMSTAEIGERVARVLDLVRLAGFGDRKPTQLSGGQQQRVALARALVVEPRVLLLDEPLSNLDARLRDEMREEIRRLHAEIGLTTVYVTHDQKEALALADRLAVMRSGKVVQVGAPAVVYERPTDIFVAGFLGEINLVPGVVRDTDPAGCHIETALGVLTAVAPAKAPAVGARVDCAIRPHALSTNAPADAANRIIGTVEHTAFLGDVVQLRVVTADGTRLAVTTLPRSDMQLSAGSPIALTAAPRQVALLTAGP